MRRPQEPTHRSREEEPVVPFNHCAQALHLCAAQPECCALLIGEGALLEERDASGFTPLQHAVCGVAPLLPCRALLQAGARANTVDHVQKQTPLHRLCDRPPGGGGDAGGETLACLLEHGATVNLQAPLAQSRETSPAAPLDAGRPLPPSSSRLPLSSPLAPRPVPIPSTPFLPCFLCTGRIATATPRCTSPLSAGRARWRSPS